VELWYVTTLSPAHHAATVTVNNKRKMSKCGEASRRLEDLELWGSCAMQRKIFHLRLLCPYLGNCDGARILYEMTQEIGAHPLHSAWPKTKLFHVQVPGSVQANLPVRSFTLSHPKEQGAFSRATNVVRVEKSEASKITNSLLKSL